MNLLPSTEFCSSLNKVVGLLFFDTVIFFHCIRIFDSGSFEVKFLINIVCLVSTAMILVLHLKSRLIEVKNKQISIKIKFPCNYYKVN